MRGWVRIPLLLLLLAGAFSLPATVEAAEPLAATKLYKICPEMAGGVEPSCFDKKEDNEASLK